MTIPSALHDGYKRFRTGRFAQDESLYKKLKDFNLYAIVMNNGRLYEELKNIKIRVLLIEENKISFFKQIFLARQFFKQNKIRIIHSHRYKENILVVHQR